MTSSDNQKYDIWRMPMWPSSLFVMYSMHKNSDSISLFNAVSKSLRSSKTIGATSLEFRRRWREARLGCRPILNNERRRHAHHDVELKVAVQVPHSCSTAIKIIHSMVRLDKCHFAQLIPLITSAEKNPESIMLRREQKMAVVVPGLSVTKRTAAHPVLGTCTVFLSCGLW